MLRPLHSRSGLQLLVDSSYLWFPIMGSLRKPSDLSPRSRNFTDLPSDFVLALRHTSNRRVVDSYLPDSTFRPLDPQARPDSSRAHSWQNHKATQWVPMHYSELWWIMAGCDELWQITVSYKELSLMATNDNSWLGHWSLTMVGCMYSIIKPTRVVQCLHCELTLMFSMIISVTLKSLLVLHPT